MHNPCLQSQPHLAEGRSVTDGPSLWHVGLRGSGHSSAPINKHLIQSITCSQETHCSHCLLCMWYPYRRLTLVCLYYLCLTVCLSIFLSFWWSVCVYLLFVCPLLICLSNPCLSLWQCVCVCLSASNNLSVCDLVVWLSLLSLFFVFLPVCLFAYPPMSLLCLFVCRSVLVTVSLSMQYTFDQIILSSCSMNMYEKYDDLYVMIVVIV